MNREYVTETALKGGCRGKPQTYMGTGAYQDPSCGDVLTYYFLADRELITSIFYTITGTSRSPSKARTETIAVLVRGRPVLEAYTIDNNVIVTAPEGLEPEYIHRAMMAEPILKRAVLDHADKRKEGQPIKAAPPI